jgi:hypothetical protein
MEGREGLTAEVDGEVLAALELDGDGDLGVLGDGKVWTDIQLEVAEALAKRRHRKLPAAMTRGSRRLVP